MEHKLLKTTHFTYKNKIIVEILTNKKWILQQNVTNSIFNLSFI